MKRELTNTDAAGNAKRGATTDEHHDPVVLWTKSPDKRPDSPAPPPVWTRYIDSRLKQFYTR
jgi:hypothetical protein